MSGTADFTLSRNKTFLEAGCAWLDVVFANTAEGVRQRCGHFEGSWKCRLELPLFTRWADGACVVAVSVNIWMLAFSVLSILLTLSSNFRSFSTFWKHALHTTLQGGHSPLLHPTLWKSSLTRASMDGEVFRRRQLRESLTELLQKRALPHGLHLKVTLPLITLFRSC